MKIITLLIFIVTVTHAYPPGQFLYSDNLSNSVDEVYDSYLSVSDDDKDDVNPPPNSLLNQLIENENANLISPAETQRVEQTSIVHVQTREKNKRYSSYLTLCHFKICNMGRKRTTRYFQVMKTLDNKT
ncbi:hypothetical protein PPYR_10448 [Photinus pyralis]|uniref:Uncharacterized protein n=1 Tax=Photinus pyralis TaxID=7054 RepID=A0A1Y1K0T0_PHOPY|nr:uncharacterized protein LOC116174327 isoform X2 [Photinus pyralis]KAB0796387.1 hypothetical protein PPYR_10448 [Photinus pyralis]